MPAGTPVWQHTNDGLAIVIGQHRYPAPSSVTDWFHRPHGLSTTADPAKDLIELEGHIRAAIATLTSAVDDAARVITKARANAANPRPSGWRSVWRSRRHRKAAAVNPRIDTDLGTAIADHANLTEALTEQRARQDDVRGFVIAVDCQEGLLAEEAAGWLRSPAVPAGVVVLDEAKFLAADERRIVSETWYGIAGCVYGQGWRRDGDDDGPDSQPLDRSGPWTLGHIPRTGEIYAVRRCGYLSRQVWLLGALPAHEAHDLLGELEPHMREPNSLILAAEVVHAARRPERTDHALA